MAAADPASLLACYRIVIRLQHLLLIIAEQFQNVRILPSEPLAQGRAIAFLNKFP